MKSILRNILIVISFFISHNYLSAQVLGKFGANQNTLDPNAVLEIESASKGFLLPRLTTVQQNAMSSPSDGMLIYNTDSACLVQCRSGFWRSLCAGLNTAAWTLVGNSGTNPTTNFLGTTDAQNLLIKANNKTRITVRAADNFAIFLDNYPTSAGGHSDVVSTLNFRTNNFQAQNGARVHFNSLVLGAAGSIGTQQISFNQADLQSAGAFGALRNVTSNLLINNAATLTDFTHFYADGTVNNSTITNYYGLRINPTISGGTITNGFGVDISTPSTATNYVGLRIAAIAAGAGVKQAFLYNNLSNPVVIAPSGFMGLGTTTPQYKLDIDALTGSSGNPLRLLGLNAGATSDSIITSNAGILRRLSIPQVIANAWNINGNAGTAASTNFIGTTDAQELVLKSNNTEGFRVKTDGGIAITTTLKVGNSSTTIDANSLLELESTTKTFVPPRMTTAQMNAITGALVGSVIYNTTLDCLHQKTVAGWLSMCNSSSPFVFEATQTSFLTQNFSSVFTNIPGVGALSITVPRTTTYTITAKTYMSSNAPTSSTSNSGIQGSFKLIIDGVTHEESYMSSVGIYNAAGNFSLYGLGGQNTSTKIITLSAGTHTIGIQGRMWAGTNCTGGTWGIPTSGYVNSGSAEAGRCKLTIVEN
jgi:hypothetical protein